MQRRIAVTNISEHLLPVLLVSWIGIYVLTSCRPARSGEPEAIDYHAPSIGETQKSGRVYAVIQVPAGTASLEGLPAEMRFGEATETNIDFLPFPGNYGFIAGCAKSDSITGSSLPLPVLVMMPALQAESVIEIRPVATVLLMHRNHPFPVVVAVPVDVALQSIHVNTFVDLITDKDGVRGILQAWFLNYLGPGMFDLVGWKDEQYTRHLITEWRIN